MRSKKVYYVSGHTSIDRYRSAWCYDQRGWFGPESKRRTDGIRHLATFVRCYSKSHALQVYRGLVRGTRQIDVCSRGKRAVFRCD